MSQDNGREKRGSARVQYLAVLSARIGSAIVQAATLIVVARHAGPAEFGYMAAALAVIGLFLNKSDFGLQTHATRLHAQPAERGKSAQVLSLQRKITLIALVATTLVCLVLVVLETGPFWLALAPLSLWLPKERAALLGVALAEGRSIIHLTTETVGRATSLGVVLALIYLLQFRATTSFIVGTIVGLAISFLPVWRYYDRYADRSYLRAVRPHMSESRHYWIAGMSGQVRSADSAIVSAIAGSYQAGIYSLPARATGPLRLAGTSMSAVALPYAARGEIGQVRSLDRLVLIMTIIAFICIAGSWPWMPEIIVFVAGDEYAASALPMQMILMAVLLNIPGSYLSGTLQGFGMSRQVARLGVVLAGVAVVATAGGAHFWGAQGAASALVLVNLGQLIAVLFMSRAARRRFR